LNEAGYDKIIEWARSILLEGNRLKENFYAAKSMMKPLGLGYQKIDMCPKFFMLYYLENVLKSAFLSRFYIIILHLKYQ
jgi:hypothetical protein